LVSLPKLVSSLDFSKGERVFFEGDGEARGLTGVEGEGLPGVEGERSELRARLEAAFTGVRKPSLSYCTCGELSRSRRLRASDLTGPPSRDFCALADEDGVTKRLDRLSWEDEGDGVTAR
jgi:hypothetical protein